jgi:hypothetical protein
LYESPKHLNGLRNQPQVLAMLREKAEFSGFDLHGDLLCSLSGNLNVPTDDSAFPHRVDPQMEISPAAQPDDERQPLSTLRTAILNTCT